MIGVLPWVVVVACLVLTLVVLVYVALDRTPDWGLLGLAGLVEAGAVVVTVVTLVQVVRGGHDIDGPAIATLIGYLLIGLMILPLGFAWSLAERGRGATTVLSIAALTLGFMVVRAIAIWG